MYIAVKHDTGMRHHGMFSPRCRARDEERQRKIQEDLGEAPRMNSLAGMAEVYLGSLVNDGGFNG